jgi:hypothetical protein
MNVNFRYLKLINFNFDITIVVVINISILVDIFVEVDEIIISTFVTVYFKKEWF